MSLLISVDAEYRNHLGFPAFVELAKERRFGIAELYSAWEWFKLGWTQGRIDSGY